MSSDMIVSKESALVEETPDNKRGWYLKQSWAEIKNAAKNIPAYSPEELDLFFADVGEGKHNNLGTYPYEVIVQRIKAYFNKITMPLYDEENPDVLVGYTYKENPSVNALGLFLNVDRNTFFKYCEEGYIAGLRQRCVWDEETRRKVFYLLTKSRQLIEDFYEKSLGENRNPAGLIYWLNNQKSGWTNQIDIVQTGQPNPLGEARSVEAAQQYAKQLESGMPEDE